MKKPILIPSTAIAKGIKDFFAIEAASGIVLGLAAILAFAVANSGASEFYFSTLQFKVAGLSIQHWVNDGLMAIFFFVVGLEIKREMAVGHLSTPKLAALPVAAAVGGMVVPALFYLLFNHHLPDASRGWGIPMATDIAFAVGVLTLFGARVPLTLKVFLLAIAIVDDLGAIMVIAFFYTNEIRGSGLAMAFAGLGLAGLLRFSGMRSYWGYVAIGAFVWFGFLYSGIHATIAGVLLGLLTPLKYPTQRNSNKTYSPLDDLIHYLHSWVSFGIMPIFAFANSGIDLRGIQIQEVVQHTIHLGIVSGLFLGKPIGIFVASFAAFKLGLATLPNGIKWQHIAATGFLAGIGFTMSLFISSLGLPASLEIYSKTGIVLGSLLSGAVGALLLAKTLPKKI